MIYNELTEFKKKYNEILATEKKAEAFFDNPNKSMSEKEKWLPKFNQIIVELSLMMKRYRKLTGKEMTSKEVLDGFNP